MCAVLARQKVSGLRPALTGIESLLRPGVASCPNWRGLPFSQNFERNFVTPKVGAVPTQDRVAR